MTLYAFYNRPFYGDDCALYGKIFQFFSTDFIYLTHDAERIGYNMALIIQRPYGTEDITPQESYKWQTVERVARETAEKFGFSEIRIPTFEQTELFLRSVGETTDVVQKEMYTVTAKESTFTLRPEGTAGVMRAMLQNGMLGDALPQRVFYNLSCFRHERPQAGRLREFHQFGAEMAGSAHPCADAEVIALAHSIISRLGIKNVILNINSIGCPACRAEYHQALKSYFREKISDMCATCLSRLEQNPMRILDCKSPVCREITQDAPLIIDYLCAGCAEHFESVKQYLKLMNIKYTVNPKIVRGLDYYTRTVFEFICPDVGAQSTISAGGRYDGLIAQLGGAPTPALGFAMGLERIILAMNKQDVDFVKPSPCDLFICSMGEEALKTAMRLAINLREDGYHAEYDVMGRNIKPQMKYAGKLGARFVLVLGENELASGCAKLKHMASGEQTDITLGEGFEKQFADAAIAEMFNGVLDRIS